MTPFQTLLYREWMQHGRGWMLICLAPLVLLLLALVFGEVQLGGFQRGDLVVLMTTATYALLQAGIGWLVAALQAGGLARRDVQDRSIEFWRSLPVSDTQAVAATVLAHVVVLPLLVMGVGLLASLPIGAVTLLRGLGWSALPGLPWGELAGAWSLLALRLLGGSLVASVWAAPLVLLSMAASAWLKRWGVPVLWAVLGFGSLLLNKAYGRPELGDLLLGLMQRFSEALSPLRDQLQQGLLDSLAGNPHALRQLPELLARDLWVQFSGLFSPAGGLAVAVAGAAFAAVVLRRQRA